MLPCNKTSRINAASVRRQMQSRCLRNQVERLYTWTPNPFDRNFISWCISKIKIIKLALTVVWYYNVLLLAIGILRSISYHYTTDCMVHQWRRNEFESGRGTGPERKWGHRWRRKIFFGRAPPLFGYKSTISRFGERFRDGQYSLVSFLFAVLLLTMPPCPAICKSGGHVPPCTMESAPLWTTKWSIRPTVYAHCDTITHDVLTIMSTIIIYYSRPINIRLCHVLGGYSSRVIFR